MECFWLSSYFLIDTIFETGPYWVQSKSQKNTILGHGGPSKVKLGNKEHLVAIKLFLNPKIPYPYEVNGKLVTRNGSLLPICSLLPSLTVVPNGRNLAGLAVGTLCLATIATLC